VVTSCRLESPESNCGAAAFFVLPRENRPNTRRVERPVVFAPLRELFEERFTHRFVRIINQNILAETLDPGSSSRGESMSIRLRCSVKRSRHPGSIQCTPQRRKCLWEKWK
jgi:hypothetical protein